MSNIIDIAVKQIMKDYPNSTIEEVQKLSEMYIAGYNQAMKEELAWLDENWKPENITVHTNHRREE